MSRSLHLLKLFVDLTTLSELVAFQREKLAKAYARKEPEELFHVTRHTPTRADELLDGGSTYWVMSSVIVARQKLLEFRPIIVDEVPHCKIIFDADLIAVEPRPHRPFQGWRYLKAADAPADIQRGKRHGDLPPEFLLELTKLGLL